MAHRRLTSRALAALALSALSDGCSRAPDPTPLPVTSASTSVAIPPPVWTSPENAAPPVPAAPPPPNPDLAKARAAAQAGEPKKVRATLDKKLKAGKLTREEAVLLADACVNLRDHACIDAIHTRFPEL